MGIIKVINRTKINSFTLIELIIVIAVVAFTLPVVFGLFFINLRAQTKLYLLQEVKRNGDGALGIMENIIKNRAYSISVDTGAGDTEVCTTKSDNNTASSYEYDTTNPPLKFKDIYANEFRFDIDANRKIASYSAAISPNPYLLTNSKVIINQFKIRCDRSSIFSPPIVSVSFRVEAKTISSRQEENVILSYQKKIKLKNY